MRWGTGLALALLAGSSALARPTRPLPIRAPNLAAAFRRDRAQANRLYAGKRLRIAGVLYSLAQDEPIILRLNTERDPIVCQFNPEIQIPDDSKLKEGSLAVVDCMCEGAGVDGNTYFVECTLPSLESVRAENPELLR